MSGHIHAQLRLAEILAAHRQHAPAIVTGLGEDLVRHFFLHHQRQALHGQAAGEQQGDQGRGDIIWDIRHHGEGLAQLGGYLR